MKSMTGYAKKQCEIGGKKLNIEIKTLNSKQLDVITKLPSQYRSLELPIRALLNRLERGKVELVLTPDGTGKGDAGLNLPLVRSRYQALCQLMAEMPMSVDAAMRSILQQPDVWCEGAEEEPGEEECRTVLYCVEEAVTECDAVRLHEGNILKEDIAKHLQIIEQKSVEVPQYEAERIETIKSHLRRDLEALQAEVNPERFEQELIYYLERLDITEEKVRLAKHLAYFRDTMALDTANGKKLNFIAQEMGREINTTGSKANHVQIQRLVVEMKDELEKIKEQLGNIL